MKTYLLVTIALLASFTQAIAQKKGGEVYLFSYFTDNGQDGLHFAYSRDGYNWSVVKDSSYLTPEVGNDKLMRDPCIIRGADKLFHMVWTVSWKEQTIGYASSPDLVHWSKQQNIPVMKHEPTTMNSWAPELTYDPEKKEYVIYWSSTIPGRFPKSDSTGDRTYNHRIFYTTTKDFKTYAPTKVLYDQDFNVIDASIVRDGKRWVMFVKDETKRPVAQKNIRVVFSDKLTEGYGKPSAPISGVEWVEGPTATKVDGNWVVYYDRYRKGDYGAAMSPDLKTWTDISDKVHFPKGMRHGTVIKVSEKEFELLKK